MVTEPDEEKTPQRGAQTLARGLRALEALAQSPNGMSIVDLADFLTVHRSIAYRILATLAEANLISRGSDGRYRGAIGLIRLAEGAYGSLRATTLPVLQMLAGRLGATVTLFVREGMYATALTVVEAPGQSFRMSFSQGNKHPLDRGAAGHAIRSLEPPSPDDSDAVRDAREKGYSITFSEVEPNLYGLAVPIPNGLPESGCCINFVTNRKELVDSALPSVIEAANEIAAELTLTPTD